MKSPRTFLLVFFLCFAVLLSIHGLINFLTDPFGIFQKYSPDFLEPFKSDRFLTRVGKAELSRSGKCRTILLGASTVEVGLDPDSETWKHKPVCNLGLTAGNILELEQVLKLSISENPDLKEVVLAADFYAFSDLEDFKHDFAGSAFNPDLNWFKYYFEALFAERTARYSYLTLSQYFANAPPLYTPLGFRIGHHNPNTLKKVLESIELDSKNGGILGSFTYTGKRIEEFKRILSLSCKATERSSVVILPSHALNLEYYRIMGLWETYWKWQKDLVNAWSQISEDCKQNVSIWNLNTYDGENLISFDDPQNQFYWERVHFKKTMGDRILQILNGKALGRTSNFSSLQDVENLRSKLEKDRATWLEKDRSIRDFIQEVTKSRTRVGLAQTN